MPRPHAAALVEDTYHGWIAGSLRERGWRTRIVPFTGYGSVAQLRVLARVLVTRASAVDEPEDMTYAGRLRAVELETRGWRAFLGAPAMDEKVTVRVNERLIPTRTDRGGYIDLTVRGHGLRPGWHQIYLSSPDAEPIEVPVLVVGTTQTHGIISDIDDTVLSTSLPRPLIAGWNTFIKAEGTRRPVSGMATLYRELLASQPGAPVVYLSTGAWNTQPLLTRFLRRNGYPAGPMLLTDWGPTNTGWFRSGQQHKQASLHRLARELPHIRWLLVGDDGQHDPTLYSDFAAKRPDRVRGIAIRELSAGEQVLSHGVPVAIDDLTSDEGTRLEVPVVRATDGYGLARGVRQLWTGEPRHSSLAVRSSAAFVSTDDQAADASTDDPPADPVPHPDER
ncbi:MAG: phosphatase domain-containing protein [Ornithinibacter sp.]